MIRIYLSDTAYENDIYPLVKAFYPEEDIKVSEITDKNMDVCAGTGNDSASTIRISIECGSAGIFITDGTGKRHESAIDVPNPEKDRQAHKNAIKRGLYGMLSSLTGKELSWGILTGIRPVKLVYEMLEKGAGEEAIFDKMAEEYLCSREKTETSIQIARRELEILTEMDYKNGYSLYIGIPFCPSTCLYCSFTSYSIEKHGDLVEDYLNALEKELRYGSTCFPDKKLSTVYLGGGTPTTLSARQLDRLLGLIKDLYDFTHVREFCVEAGRPDSITREKLEVIKSHGVNRISVNPQSMQQRTLDLIGRRHTVEQINDAFRMARDLGFDNINMDIIIGLLGETPSDVRDTLEKIRPLDPESLTVHTLAIKRAARLNIEKDQYRGLRAQNTAEMLRITREYACKNGYLPYYLYRQKNMEDNLENIGYARHGREGLYNILIMEEKQTILAMGAGAMSKFVFHDMNKIERVENVKALKDYIGRIDEMINRKKEFLLNNPGL